MLSELLLGAHAVVPTFTVIGAVAVLPLPASLDVTALVTLVAVPAVLPVTFTEKVQLALAANVAPDRLTLLEPATAVMVPPPQLPVSPLGVATTTTEGSGSVKPIPLRLPVVLGLLIVKERTLFAPTLIVAGAKVFAMTGGFRTTQFSEFGENAMFTVFPSDVFRCAVPVSV